MTYERTLPLFFPFVLTLVLFILFVILPEKELENPNKLGRREAIKSAFEFAWNGYYRIAFPHDELHPVSNTSGFSRNDWGATAVDALGTAILMEMPDAIKTVLDHVQ